MIPDLIQEYPEGYYDYLAQCYQEEDEQMRKDFEDRLVGNVIVELK